MQILWLETVDSTQHYLKDALKKKLFDPPVCVAAKEQTSGYGSRGSSWEGAEGNLYFSFALDTNSLVNDLKLESASIYFSYLLKEVLQEAGSDVWLKWPNDFYIDEKKIGGTLTTLSKNVIICGIGLNLQQVSEEFGVLDICLSRQDILKYFFIKFEKKISWKYIFSKYELEFERSKKYISHSGSEAVPLQEAKMLEDGSILWNGQRIFSLR
jgi:BirA family transcriptional regulator, biotin operon repressor / biotin---[acetyl-CoA-carboxylase] ligase